MRSCLGVLVIAASTLAFADVPPKDAGYAPPLKARGIPVAGTNGIATLEMMLVNSNGQVLETRSLTVGVGTQNYQLNMDRAPGTYFVSLKTAQGTLPTQRILVIK